MATMTLPCDASSVLRSSLEASLDEQLVTCASPASLGVGETTPPKRCVRAELLSSESSVSQSASPPVQSTNWKLAWPAGDCRLRVLPDAMFTSL